MKSTVNSGKAIWATFPPGLRSVVGVTTILMISMLLISVSAITATKAWSSDLTQSIMMAKNSLQLSDYDRAYCSSKGRFVQLVDVADVRGVACWSGTELFYEGVNKITGDTIRLEALVHGNEVVSASNGGTEYEMTPNGLFIKTYGKAKESFWAEEVKYRSKNLIELPGDLQIEGQGISYPDCDGRLVEVLTVVDDGNAKAEVEKALSENAGTKYLRSDLSCDNFNMPSREISNGDYMYAVYKTFPNSQSKKDDLCEEIKDKFTGDPTEPLLIIDTLQDGVLSSSNLCTSAP